MRMDVALDLLSIPSKSSHHSSWPPKVGSIGIGESLFCIMARSEPGILLLGVDSVGDPLSRLLADVLPEEVGRD